MLPFNDTKVIIFGSNKWNNWEITFKIYLIEDQSNISERGSVAVSSITKSIDNLSKRLPLDLFIASDL